MINRLKCKWWAKLLAAILLFMAGVGCLAGMIGVYTCSAYRIYNESIEETQERLNREMLSKYAVLAMADYVGVANRKLSPNYHYAIYEGSGTEGKKVAGDLEGSVPEDAVIHEFAISDSTGYRLADSMFEDAYVLGGNDDYGIEEQIRQFYYCVVPVENETRGDADAALTAGEAQTDTAAGTVENAAAGTDTAAGTAENAAADQTSGTGAAEEYTIEGAAEEYTIELYVTGTNTSGSILYRVDPKLYRVDEKKGMIWLTRNIGGELGVPASKMEEIALASSDIAISPYMVKLFYLDDSCGGQIENGWFRAGTEAGGTVYTVAGDVAEKLTLTGSWMTADFFEQVQILLGWLYTVRYAAFALILGGFILGLLLFIFLMIAAGHREEVSGNAAGSDSQAEGPLVKGTDVRLLAIDRVPMDLALCAAGVICSICAIPALEMWDRASFAKSVCVLFVCLVAAYIVALEFCMSFAVNVKVGGWWERTLICRIWKNAGRFFRWLWRMIGVLFGKLRESVSGVRMGTRAWALFALYVACEFIGIVIFRHDPSRLLLCWLVEKVIFFFALLKVLLEFGKIKRAGEEITGGNLEYKVETNKMFLDFADVGNSLNRIGDGIAYAVDERMKSERMKTELITNVSHDIKTPLTSIINYTDLLTKLNLEDPTAREYLEVLGRQSARLKKLIEDLIEASKASSGVLKLDMETVNASMLLMQAVGEYGEKFSRKGLDLRVTGETAEMKVRADSRYLWRVFDNLMSNMLKYAQAGTRAYIDMLSEGGEVSIIFRNISETPLHITGEELMERFVRGDSSRSTEGSGLGLSIADSLVTLMGGNMEIIVDGDLFKVVVRIPTAG